MSAGRKALPGVALVMTGADVAKGTGPLPCFSNPPVEQRCVALERVRHVGEPVAIVAAESRYLAEDALELIEVEYEALPAVVDPEAAITREGRCRAPSASAGPPTSPCIASSRSARSTRILRTPTS